MKRFLILLCFATAAPAQQPGVPQAAQPGVPQSAQSSFQQRLKAIIDPLTGLPQTVPEEQSVRMDLDFPGGPPELLLDLMQKVSTRKPNVIIHNDAANLVLPAFKLRDVTAAQVFIALNTLGEPNYSNGMWQQVQISDGEIWTLTAQPNRPPQNPYGGYGSVIPVAQQPPPQKQCRVFNLSQVLEDYSIEDVTTAIQGAWELMKAGDSQISFHKDTKLLIVFGQPMQVSVVQEVLAELRINVERKRASVEKPKPAPEPKKQ